MGVVQGACSGQKKKKKKKSMDIKSIDKVPSLVTWLPLKSVCELNITHRAVDQCHDAIFTYPGVSLIQVSTSCYIKS